MHLVWLKRHDFMDDFLRHLSCKLSVNPSFHSLHHLLLWKSPENIKFPLFLQILSEQQDAMDKWVHGESWRDEREEGDSESDEDKGGDVTLVIIMMGWPGTMLSQIIIVILSLKQWIKSTKLNNYWELKVYKISISYLKTVLCSFSYDLLEHHWKERENR